MAVALAESGHRVAVNYFERAARAEELCEGLREKGWWRKRFRGMCGTRLMLRGW